MKVVSRVCDNCGRGDVEEFPVGGWGTVAMMGIGGTYSDLVADLCPECHGRMFKGFDEMILRLRKKKLVQR